MNYFEYYIDAFRHYADFEGRTKREPFIWFYIFHIVISILLICILHSLYVLYTFLVFIPVLSILVRRLHDTNRSGFNIFWLLLPFIGLIILLIMLLSPSIDNNE